VKTKKGTLLAFAEARKNNCSDEGDINMVVRRSVDSGKAWSALISVWDDGANTCGNPAPVVDLKTGEVYLLMTWNLGQDNIGEINNGTSKDTRRVYVSHSSDDGLSWSVPIEITDSVKRTNWGWYATGPCHGIQIRRGQFAGRLVIPCDYMETYTKKGGSHIIYSDDDGKSWALGGTVSNVNTNESTVAELQNGKLMLNMRSKGTRVVAISDDGGLSWTDVKHDNHLIDPTCQGSLLSNLDEAQLFFSNPSSSERENMTIKLSGDDGNSWRKSLQVYGGPSAYSDMVLISDTRIGILYEGGKSRPYEGIVFQSIPIKEIN
jgi:sialidase-1